MFNFCITSIGPSTRLSQVHAECAIPWCPSQMYNNKIKAGSKIKKLQLKGHSALKTTNQNKSKSEFKAKYRHLQWV